MKKQKLMIALCEQLDQDLATQKAAAIATYEAATGEESKPENEYDTRGLEASYLAGAQAKRVGEIEELLTIYKFIELKDFSNNTAIDSTALVEVDLNGKKSILFLLPKGGGVNISFEGKNVQVITPSSPLGEALLGLKQGDIAVVETGNQPKEYEILSVS